MKKSLAIILAATMLLLTACSSPAETTTTEEETTTTGETSTVDFPSGDSMTFYYGKKTGGLGDLVLRSIARHLGENLGITITVENVTGASGAVMATQYQAEKPNSDSMILFGNALFTEMQLTGQVNFSLDDFEPVIGLDMQERILFVNPKETGITNFEEFVTYGKENGIVYSSSGAGSAKDLIFRTLFTLTGIEGRMVADDGEGLVPLLGGHVEATLSAPGDAEQYLLEGLVPIAVYSEEDYTGYEGITVPSLKGLGYDIVNTGYRFMAMSNDTDPEIVQYMHDELKKVFEDPEFIAEMEALQVDMSSHTPDEVEAQIQFMVDSMIEYNEINNQG